MLTIEQLMATSAKSREEELTSFFGRNKALNTRSLVTRKANKKLQKERQEQWAAKYNVTKAKKVGTEGKQPSPCPAAAGQ